MALTVVPATGDVLERVLADTLPLWNDGLSDEDYRKQWSAQLKTPWGAAHLDRVALVDGPHVISSAKRYDLSLRLDGRIRRVLGIGAVFTMTLRDGSILDRYSRPPSAPGSSVITQMKPFP